MLKNIRVRFERHVKLCPESTVISLKFEYIHRKSLDISVALKLEGKSKILHFSL